MGYGSWVHGRIRGPRLVLVREETVRVLYVGSASAGDAGWLYGEVLCYVARIYVQVSLLPILLQSC